MVSKGDASDYALPETINGLCKAESIHRRGTVEDQELVVVATLAWESQSTGPRFESVKRRQQYFCGFPLKFKSPA